MRTLRLTLASMLLLFSGGTAYALDSDESCEISCKTISSLCGIGATVCEKFICERLCSVTVHKGKAEKKEPSDKCGSEKEKDKDKDKDNDDGD